MSEPPAASREKTGLFSKMPSKIAHPRYQLLQKVWVLNPLWGPSCTPGGHRMLLFFCRRNHEEFLSWQQSIISRSSFQPFVCFEPSSWFQTRHRLQTQVHPQAWTVTSYWTETWFCRPTSQSFCGTNQHSDTWLGTAVTVFTLFWSYNKANCLFFPR